MGRKARRTDLSTSPTPVASEGDVAARNQTSSVQSSAVGLDARHIALEASRCAIVTDSNGRVVFWNGAAGELFGKRIEQATGRDLQEIIDAHDVFGNRLCSGHSAFHEMVRAGEAPEAFELDVATPSGRRRRVAVSIVVVLGPEPGRYDLVYLMTPRRSRRRTDEAIDRLLSRRSSLEVSQPGEPARAHPEISRRQCQVLELVAAGLKAGDIADELSISVHTVRSHIRAVMETLDASSQAEAVAKAVRGRLI